MRMSTGFVILLLLSVPAGAEMAQRPGGSLDRTANAQAKGEAEVSKRVKNQMALVDQLRALTKEQRYQEATTQWEEASKSDPYLIDKLDRIRWTLAQAYVKQDEYEKAINIFRRRDFDALSTEQRAELGEVLLFGETGFYPVGERYLIGRAQCALCHAFSKDTEMAKQPSPPWGPHLFNFTKRIKKLIVSPQYQKRSNKTEQPEAFPGSGIATSVIEYLAESNVCPSCYITPGFGIRNTHDHESPMPKIHAPAISLTIDEMIAVDTYLLRREGEQVPSLAVMRAAYEKFLRPADRPPGGYEKIQLASLYDVKGDSEEALRLLETTGYSAVEPYMMKMSDRALASFREDLRFPNLEQRPEIVKKYPLLFRMPQEH